MVSLSSEINRERDYVVRNPVHVAHVYVQRTPYGGGSTGLCVLG